MIKDKEIEERLLTAQFKQAAGRHFVSGKQKNVQKEKLRGLARTGDFNKITEKRGLGRNDPCICGSGKKYKKCCMFFTVEKKRLMFKETADWSIEATVNIRIDNRKQSKEITGLHVEGTIQGELTVGHTFDLGEIHVELEGEARIIKCENDISTFIAEGLAGWPRKWNEPWAQPQ